MSAYGSGSGAAANDSYQDPKMTQVKQQVNEVTGIMRTNIDQVMQRGDRLQDLGEKAEGLEVRAQMFESTAGRVKRKMWWENCKMKLIIAGVVTAIIVIIIIVIVTSIPTSSEDPTTTTAAVKNAAVTTARPTQTTASAGRR